MKRVLVIVPFAMSDDEIGRRKDQLKAVKLGADMEFHFRAVRVGPANYTSQHDFTLADFSILDAGLDAERDGFDAVCIDTMSDSGMSALRSVSAPHGFRSAVLHVPARHSTAPARIAYSHCSPSTSGAAICRITMR